MSDPVEALADDADPQVTQFTWAGRAWIVHRVDLRVMAALEAGKLGRALSLMIGPEQLNELLAIDTDEELTFATVTAGIKAWSEARGTTPGESAASTDS